MTDLLPAWYYNFRVSMVTWGDPPLSCCDSSTVSFVTGTAEKGTASCSYFTIKAFRPVVVVYLFPAPEAPHVSSVDYSHGVLYVRWTYGELFIDLSHSRMLHWQVVAVGKKGGDRSYSVDVSLSTVIQTSDRVGRPSGGSEVRGHVTRSGLVYLNFQFVRLVISCIDRSTRERNQRAFLESSGTVTIATIMMIMVW